MAIPRCIALGTPPRRVIGIDAGGTKLLGGVVDEGLVVHHRVHRTWRGDRQETLDIMVDAVEEVQGGSRRRRGGLRYPGPGRGGHRRVALVHSPAAGGRAFRDLMSERLGLPVEVDNDSTVALIAEHRFGAAREVRHAALITLGTGIGGGLLLDGRVYRGAHGFGSELGHIVVDLDGPDWLRAPGAAASRSWRPAAPSGSPAARPAGRHRTRSSAARGGRRRDQRRAGHRACPRRRHGGP